MYYFKLSRWQHWSDLVWIWKLTRFRPSYFLGGDSLEIPGCRVGEEVKINKTNPQTDVALVA